MSICGKLKSVRRGKNKRLAKCKSLFVITNISLIVALSCVNKYLCVPVFADTEVSYYTPQEVGNITIGDMVISLQNASGFTITDESYINAIKNNMSGTDQDIDHIMAMSEEDAVQYLNVCINNAESAGATKLSNSLSISSDMANYLNQQVPNAGVVAQNGGELLYESIKETYNQNTQNDDILSRSRAVMQGALKRVASGVAQSPQDLARLTITGIAGTMFGIPGAVTAGLQTGLFSPNVKTGSAITTKQSVINNMPSGTASIQRYRYEYQVNKFAEQIYYSTSGFYPCIYTNGSTIYLVWLISNTYNDTLPYSQNPFTRIEYRSLSNGSGYKYYSINITSDISHTYSGFLYDISSYGNNYLTAMTSFWNDMIGGNVDQVNPKSPDVVSNQGNVNYDPDTQTINIIQNYDPADNYFLPIKIGSDSYGDYITNLNNNTTNNDYSQNGDVYNNYL